MKYIPELFKTIDSLFNIRHSLPAVKKMRKKKQEKYK
jgi:hypothetical protein